MEKEAYSQYLDESDNWLNKGRRHLLGNLVSRHFKNSKRISVLEVGAGSGKSADILSIYGDLDVVETEPSAIRQLQKNKAITQIYTEAVPFELKKKYNLIIAMDVIEHIEDDQSAFDWMLEHLESGGILVLTVPAFQWLYSGHDKALNHFRRYTLKDIFNLNRNQLRKIQGTYFNFLLFPLAVVSRIAGKLQKKSDNHGKKQSSSVPSFLDKIFYSMLRLESVLIKKGVSLPCGLTAVVLFRNEE